MSFGVVAVVILLVSVYLGSGALRWFDAALAPYLFGTLLAVFATVYRYVVWLRRLPTARLNQRGWEALKARGKLGSNLVALGGLLVSNIALQRFIANRSRARWIAHQLLFWGCILAALVTFPLTFGWFHFESADPTGRTYVAYLGPFATISFDSRGLLGWMIFHVLNVAAVLVIAGVTIFLIRRFRDRGAMALERGGDLAVLAGLFAVSVTGLMLTASSLWMEGRGRLHRDHGNGGLGHGEPIRVPVPGPDGVSLLLNPDDGFGGSSQHRFRASHLCRCRLPGAGGLRPHRRRARPVDRRDAAEGGRRCAVLGAHLRVHGVAAGPPPSRRGHTTLIVSLGILRTVPQFGVLMLAVVLLTIQGFIINRAAGIDYPVWAPRKT